MAFVLERRTVVRTLIRIDCIDLVKLRNDLNDHGYAELIEGVTNQADLIRLLQRDPEALASVFYVAINSSGYGVPEDVFMDGEDYQIVVEQNP